MVVRKLDPTGGMIFAMPSLILETAVVEKVWGVDVRVKVGKVQARPWESAKKDRLALSNRNEFAICAFYIMFEIFSTCFQLNGGARRSAGNTLAGVKQAVSSWLAS